MILVSAIITTHGRLELLKKAIESVVNQSYKQIELIVVDDCSEDGTREWMSSQSIYNLNYIYIEKERSKGGNHARNIGIAASHGEFIAFLDDDDLWAPEKIEKQVEVIEKNKEVVLMYCGHTKVYDNGSKFVCLPDPEFVGDLSAKVFESVFCTTSMILIRRQALELIGLFDENLNYWQEYDLVIRLCQQGMVGCVFEPLVYILHASTDPKRLSNKVDGWLDAVNYVNTKYSNLISSLPNKVKIKRELMILNDGANRCAMGNDMKRHREFLKKAWKTEPTFKHWIKYFFNITNYQVRSIKAALRNIRY